MDPNQTVTSTGLVTTSSDSLKETMNHMDWLNLPLNLFDLLEYVSSSAFDELHRSIFDDRFIARLQDGKTITTSSMLIDTTKAIVDVDDIIESAGDASEINPLPQFRLKTPSGELQTPQDIYEGVRESKYARLSEETVNRLTQIRTAWKTMMSAGWTRLEESDLCVLAEEKTTKDAEDIATFLARILKKQTCMTDRVATDRSLGKAAITLYSLVGLTAGPSAKQGIVRSMIMMSTQDSEVLALLGRVTDLVSTAVAGKGCHDRRDDIKKYCCKDGRSLREAMKDLELSKDGNGWHTTLRDDL